MIPNRFVTIYEIVRKEIKEHFKTKRLFIFGIGFSIMFCVLAVYGNIITGGLSTEYTWESGPNRTLSAVMSFSSFFPAIIAIAMTYNTVSGERDKKSLILVLSKPVDRSSIFIGKFLSSFISISFIYTLVMLVGYGIAAGLYGRSVPGNDVANALAGIGVVILGIAVWISFTLMFSTILRNPTTCIVVMVVLWLFALPLISQAGLIYFAVSSSNAIEDQPINVDVTIGSTSYLPPYNDVIFNSSVLSRPVADINISLINETGVPYTTRLPFQGPQEIFIDVPLGHYKWIAKGATTGDTIEEGEIYIDGIHMILTNISADKDRFYNDYNLIMINGTFPEMDASVVIRDSAGEVVASRSGALAIYRFEDLKEGDYDVEVSVGGEIIYREEIHSYGTFKITDFFAVFTGEVEDFPDYVSFLFAINPDSDMGVSSSIVEDTGTTSRFNLQLLEANEGITGLVVYFLGTFFIGILVFEKMDPN